MQSINDAMDGEKIGCHEADVSIVIPCLNESQVLPYCMELAGSLKEKLARELGLTCEIVVSDNGSTDGSRQIAEDLGAKVVRCDKRGYGNALRYGIENSSGRFIVMGDADGSYDFAQAFPMIESLESGAELCMGSRFKGGIEKGAMPWKNRYVGNPILTGILNLFFSTGVSDAHCGLRAFTRDAYNKINPSSEGMEFASELVVKAALLKIKITEVPITLYVDKRERDPHLRPWRDGWRHLRYLIMLSPLWLFFLPSAVIGGIGLAVFFVLISGDAGEVVRIGDLWVGDHWAVLAGGMLSVSHMSLFFGLFATLYGINEGYRSCRQYHYWVFKFCQLEVLLFVGGGLIVIGLAGVAHILSVWEASEFKGLQMIRELAFSNAFLITGIQTIFSGFLMSTISGNSNLYVKLKLNTGRGLSER